MKLNKIILLVVAFVALSVSFGYGQGVYERTVTGLDRVSTEGDFYYRGTNIPVLDISYHEFSADGTSWRKNYVAGDCYVRFANTTNNTANPNGTGGGYHTDWWVYNFCEAQEGGGSDTIYVVVGGDTIAVNDFTVNIPVPDSITGSSTNYMDSTFHTHELYIVLNDNEDVEAYPEADGWVIKWNAAIQKWIAAPDNTLPGGAGGLRVTEEDNSPSVNNVTEIRVPNSHLINNGAGSVSLILSIEPIYGANDYWRAGIETSVAEGTHTLTFSSPFDSLDYTVVSAFGIYPNSMRQNFAYGNLTLSGFDVYGVMEENVEIHYLAIRNVDSLLAVMAEMGKVLASPSDMVYGYLANKVDDSTITVFNNQLTVLNAPNADSLGGIAADEYATLDSIDVLLGNGIDVGGVNTPIVVLEDTTLSSPVVPGAIEYSDEKYYVTSVGKQRVVDRSSDVLSSTATVENTVTATDVYTIPIAGGDLRTGNVIKFHVDGAVSTATAAEGITLSIYFGTTLIETLAPSLGSLTGAVWTVDGNITVRSIGATGEIAIHGRSVIDTNVDEVVGLHTVDTTTSNDITVRVTWAAAKTGNSFSVYQGYTEFKN